MKVLNLESMETISATGSRDCLIAGATAGLTFIAGFVSPSFWGTTAGIFAGGALGGCFK